MKKHEISLIIIILLEYFQKKHFKDISFSDITCFYGGNGSGKTTLFNIISDNIDSIKKTNYDKGSHFNLYMNHCNYDMTLEEPMIENFSI